VVVQSVLRALGTVLDRPVAERGFGVTSGSPLGWEPFEGEACWDRARRLLQHLNWVGGEVLFVRKGRADIWPTLDRCSRAWLDEWAISSEADCGRDVGTVIFSDSREQGGDGTGTSSWRTLAGDAI